MKTKRYALRNERGYWLGDGSRFHKDINSAETRRHSYDWAPYVGEVVVPVLVTIKIAKEKP